MRFPPILMIWALLVGVVFADVKTPTTAESPSVSVQTEAAPNLLALSPDKDPGTPPVSQPALPENVAIDKKYEVTKVHILNNTETYKDGGNEALVFEKKYWNFGAVTAEDKEARRGMIYLASWKNDGPSEKLLAKFSYRQLNTKDEIHFQQQEVASDHGMNRVTFKVVGKEFRQNGAVYSWRLTYVRGEQIIAMEHSYIW